MVKLGEGFIIMHVLRIAPLVAALMACASGAVAQETQAYTYDVHGRLTKVARTQGTTTRTTSYAIDNANNRTSRAITSTTSSSGAMAKPGGPALNEEMEAYADAEDGASHGPADAVVDAVLETEDDLLPAIEPHPSRMSGK